VLTSSFPDNNEGASAAGVFVQHFASELSQHCKVTLLAPGRKPEEKTIGNMRVLRFPAAGLPLAELSPLNPLDWLRGWVAIRRGRKYAARLIRQDDIDHILAFWVVPSMLWIPKNAKDLPCSIWALGSDIWKISKLPFGKILLRHLLKRADYRFADGMELARATADIAGTSCEFLPSSRQLAVSDIPRRATPPYRLAFLGRWHPNKGPDILLDALRQLDEADWKNIESVAIAGGGPLEKQIKDMCALLIAEGRPVRMRGYLDPFEAVEFLQASDFVMIPSRIESIPVIFSDAMQCGRPVISTPVGDLPDLIERLDVGFLSESANSAAFAKAIQQALGSISNPQEAERLRLAKEEFSVSGAVRQFLEQTNNQQSRLAAK